MRNTSVKLKKDIRSEIFATLCNICKVSVLNEVLLSIQRPIFGNVTIRGKNDMV
jgi:hypothetical protein